MRWCRKCCSPGQRTGIGSHCIRCASSKMARGVFPACKFCQDLPRRRIAREPRDGLTPIAVYLRCIQNLRSWPALYDVRTPMAYATSAAAATRLGVHQTRRQTFCLFSRALSISNARRQSPLFFRERQANLRVQSFQHIQRFASVRRSHMHEHRTLVSRIQDAMRH